jgi:hypothetical protein
MNQILSSRTQTNLQRNLLNKTLYAKESYQYLQPHFAHFSIQRISGSIHGDGCREQREPISQRVGGRFSPLLINRPQRRHVGHKSLYYKGGREMRLFSRFYMATLYATRPLETTLAGSSADARKEGLTNLLL